MKISSFFFSFVFTSAVLITEAANCKAINHVCMDNNPRKSTPKSGALRNFRSPLYTFVFIILWPFHELVSIGGWKLLTRLCRRNSSAECKSEFMMKNTKSFFRLLELPSVAHCCAGKCLLIEAYEWGRKKMLNIIHRFYACVGVLPTPATPHKSLDDEMLFRAQRASESRECGEKFCIQHVTTF